MSEETHTVNVVYNIENIDQSIRETQRVLYFTNALRLSIVDIQKVMAGPTLSNVMWTAVQLTRVWTNLYRIIKQTNQAQAVGLGISGARGLSGASLGATITTTGGLSSTVASQWSVSGAFGAATATKNTANMGLWATLTAFAAANPYVIAGAAIALGVAGVTLHDVAWRRRRMAWREEQREIARNQGLEF